MNEGTIKLVEKNGKWKAQVHGISDTLAEKPTAISAAMTEAKEWEALVAVFPTVETPYHVTKERALNAGVKILRERMLEEGE